MLRMVLRDLQWRRRRFLLAGLATALVFSLTIVLTAVTLSLRSELERTVERFGADAWYIPADAEGPFTGAPQVPVTAADTLAALPGVERAEPVLIFNGTISDDGIEDINLIAQEADGLGWPDLEEGVQATARGQVVTDTQLGYDPGDRLTIGGIPLEVVGTADRVAFAFGLPTVFLILEDAQALALDGAPVANAVVTKGASDQTPDGLKRLDDDAVFDDLARPAKPATQSMNLIRILLTIAAAGIIGLIVYLSSIERTADLAVLRATGSTKRFMAGGLALQALVLSLMSAVGAAGLAAIIGPMFPVTFEVGLSTYVILLLLAVIVGVLASIAGVWRAVRVDPATAFGGA